jgi:hypothetical protein
MSDIFGLALAIVIGVITVAAFFTTLAALFPDRVAKVRAVAARAPGRSFLLGLINAVFFIAVILGLQALADSTEFGLFSVPALVLFAFLCIAALFGLAGVAQLVGERILPERGHYARLAAGAVVVGLGCALPFVGWFALLPYVVGLGLGAFVLSFIETPRAA